MKELEGKRVFLRPTGNNVRRHKHRGNGCRWATLIKVARVNVTLKFEGGFQEEKFRKSEYDDRAVESDCNAGWIIFEDEEAYLQVRKKERLAYQISELFRNHNKLEGLSLEKLEQIADILEITTTE